MVLAYKTPWRRAMFAETLSWTADPELSKQLATYADSAEVGKLRHFLLYCHQTDYDCVRRAISISTRDHDNYMAMAENLKASTYIEYGDTVVQFKNVDSAMRVRYFTSIRGPSAALGIPHEYVRLQILAYAGHRILWSSYRSTLRYRQSHFRMRGLAQKLWQDKNIVFPALGVPEGHELHRRLNELASRYFIYLEGVSGTVDSVCSGSLITEDRSPYHCLNSQGRAWDTKQAKIDEYIDQLGPVLTNSTGAYSVKTPPLDTPWTYSVGTNPWPEYPRPQLERSQWQNLNGIWQYRNATGTDAVNNPPFNQTLGQEVLIPSCLESGLSGIQGNWTRYSWFSTSFSVPSSWTEKTLLNFGAVDYEAWIYVNGQYAGFNRGGYLAFTVDVTDFVTLGSSNELLVFVHDPTDSDDNVIPIGKQTLNPSHIFYTPCSGIWQSVWIESAPAEYITEVQLSAGADGQVNATIHTSANSTSEVTITICDRKSNGTIATYTGGANTASSFSVDSPSLWSPNTPTLYGVTVTLGQDVVSSYTAFRTISRGQVNGIERPLLNGEFIFLFGTLDQGFWPDGIYTPPNREAMVFDLETLKQVGMNMVRKHIKVETALFYQACDEMGLMVIQDQPSLRPLQSRTLDNCTVQTILPDAAQQAEFQRQLEVLVKQHRNYPSIVTWVVYNEGWGQVIDGYPEFGLTDLVRSLDPTRLVDSTTGWYDHGAGDFSDNHHYANAQCGTPWYSIASSPYDPKRIGFQGEFGGIGQNVSIDHLWNVQAAINTINQTYEIDETNDIWNYRAHFLLAELESQVKQFACSGGVWTQTTDVEGEVNGLLTYDRRVLRPNVAQWQSDIKALYDAAAARTNGSTPAPYLL
ncbi:hypothetical protein B0A48_16132 [Cryoendolithus antarcticus]|uniref:Glycoside hydrolase family 2 immunoglobulin-like beta-sandwich domain-containing protein n=1 Tax=Cryoendolithus antarcticus TaxID=1507870 RepID=A0A1V8SF94_9PEZI|nr:hypothetical protein B0A48_16132 [Cryoendolithus antarcticus]